MIDVTRRAALGGLAVGAAGFAVSSAASAQEVAPMSTPPPAFAGQHQPKPLRFAAASLDGLSERLIQSHWENNYSGSVRTLNAIETRLVAALADPDFPPAAYGGLKREQLLRTGSVVLHEIYFDGLGGNGEAAGGLRDAVTAAFGSFDAWRTDFTRTAAALGGGSGWVILAFNAHTGQLQNYWSWDHMHGPASSVPLVVLDMYEHSYQMDYGAAAARYIDAWFRNLDWELADRRYREAAAGGGGRP